MAIPNELLKQTILLIRGQKVILDRDLARLYGVSTKVLNQTTDFKFGIGETTRTISRRLMMRTFERFLRPFVN
ncbi:MAG: hypothetical protein DMF69_16695 [Acidobacteria bacterium]|nr:MAG: hypothetical protein DMF69_16695 [Acidobacteriota bacterium]